MKKLGLVAAVALILFFVINQPDEAAKRVNQGTAGAQEGADSAVAFVNGLSAGTIAFILVIGIAWFLTRGR